MEKSSFELSRIYAQGWSAGRKCNAEEASVIDGLGDSLNPCEALEERARWRQGFTESALRNLSKLEKLANLP